MARVPKYYLVKQEVLDLIDGLVPGDALPTERDLAERFATSRTTVRQAIAELVVEGRLERVQGSGTFVARPKLMLVRPLTSFSQDLRSGGFVPGSELIGVVEVTADEAVAAALGIEVGAPVWRVERVRTADGDPIAHEVAHVPHPAPGLSEHVSSGGSLYAYLAGQGRAVDRVEDVVETVLAGPVEADRLDAEIGAPIMLVHRTAWDEGNEPVEWTRSTFRGDRFRFVSRQHLEG
ncbi:MAG: GntR family transcriptional regulator [Mobilicoccus sp.]|nr:GntR family transcriptional regulator [Mobilicoccus sp.]